MRVLHAPIAALYQPHMYVKGLRSQGVYADYMVHDFKGFEWLVRGADYNLELRTNSSLQKNKSREIEFLLHAVENYDVIHLHSGFSLLDAHFSLWDHLSDLAYLKQMKKKIVMSWWGCDLRTEKVDIIHKWSACNKCEDSIRSVCSLPEKKNRLEKVFKYVDLHLSSGDLVASYSQLKWLDLAIDCDEFRPLLLEDIPKEFLLPKTDKIRIYHAFGNSNSRGDVKGTSYIKNAVQKLQSEGFGVEFIFFDNVPNTKVKYYQAQADIVVDQLLSGWHGSNGVECLAMGKPVITYIRPEVEKMISREHPVIHASPDSIYECLKSLVGSGRDNLLQIGKKSRQYCLDVHSHLIVGKKLKEYYNEILS